MLPSAGRSSVTNAYQPSRHSIITVANPACYVGELMLTSGRYSGQ